MLSWLGLTFKFHSKIIESNIDKQACRKKYLGSTITKFNVHNIKIFLYSMKRFSKCFKTQEQKGGCMPITIMQLKLSYHNENLR